MRRVRTSTWVLIAVFVISLAAYIMVKPKPREAVVSHSTAHTTPPLFKPATSTPAAAPTPRPSPTPG